MTRPKLPIGLSDFKEIQEQQYLYVDKSLFIREILNRAAKVLLLPRPRRFGKTLNLSMLRYFFEHTEASHRHLFQGLAVEEDAEVMAHQGQYPVIFLTFKNVKAPDFVSCLRKIHQLISREYGRHSSLSPSLNTAMEQRQWQAILQGTADQPTLMDALSLLMCTLRRKYGQRVIVLLDEYDAPIHAGYRYGYYEEILAFMRSLLTAALKDNTDLEKGVLTGILRIAKASIFSDLNNLAVYSLLNLGFSERFGFTPAEVARLVESFGVTKSLPLLEEWYNGYLFGKQVIYNPWSVLNFLDKYPEEPDAYWIDSSGNELIRELISEGDPDVQDALERLLSGETLECTLNDNIVLRDIRSTSETVLNLLLYSGYLTPVKRVGKGGRARYEVAIPNQEVRLFYEETVRHWLLRQTGNQRIQQLLKALTQKEITTFGKLLQDVAIAVLSYHDTGGDEPERVYHAFVLGLLVHLQDRYTIRSNRESGYGRYDVLMVPQTMNAPGGLCLNLKRWIKTTTRRRKMP
ncbi:MAG: AAA family ATPase [bacterium]|nr:AAA family ATPase [bacterium]